MNILEPKAGDKFTHDKGWRNHNNPQEDGEKYKSLGMEVKIIPYVPVVK